MKRKKKCPYFIQLKKKNQGTNYGFLKKKKQKNRRNSGRVFFGKEKTVVFIDLMIKLKKKKKIWEIKKGPKLI